MDVGQIKVFVHAIAKFKPTVFFKDIFTQILLKTPVTAVFSLVEEKNELVHESYAGDFIYEVNGKLLSFREILIREKVTSPRFVTGDFNKMLFEKRAAILAPNNILTKGTISDYQPSISDDRSTISCDVIDLIDERFEIHKHVLGEGTVYILYLDSFYWLYNDNLSLYSFILFYFIPYVKYFVIFHKLNIFFLIFQFGIVCKGYDLFEKAEVAVKLFKSDIYNHRKALKENLREAELVQRFCHPNIIALIQQLDVPDHGICLIFPLMESDLDEEIHVKPGVIETKRAKEIMAMLLSGLNHMHERNIVHRDLKPSNVLVASGGQIKIGDLGLAAELAPGKYLEKPAGTLRYRSPETFLHVYNEKVDIWVSNYLEEKQINQFSC